MTNRMLAVLTCLTLAVAMLGLTGCLDKHDTHISTSVTTAR